MICADTIFPFYLLANCNHRPSQNIFFLAKLAFAFSPMIVLKYVLRGPVVDLNPEMRGLPLGSPLGGFGVFALSPEICEPNQ